MVYFTLLLLTQLTRGDILLEQSYCLHAIDDSS